MNGTSGKRRPFSGTSKRRNGPANIAWRISKLGPLTSLAPPICTSIACSWFCGLNLTRLVPDTIATACTWRL